jgi:integrase
MRYATEDFKYLCDEELDKFLSVIPDPNQATGREKVWRLRNLLMIDLMALHGLRIIEVQRANVEDHDREGREPRPAGAGQDPRPESCICGRTPGGRINADGTPLFSTISRHCHRLGPENPFSLPL